MKLLITHIDLDGYGAAVIAKAFKFVDKIIHADYDYVDEKIAEALATPGLTELYIVDISPQSPEAIKALDMAHTKGVKVQVYDHHQTALDAVGQRDWAYYDMDRCGTKIFAEEEGLTKGYEDFIFHVNDYDLWRHESPKSKDLNYLMYLLRPDKFVRRFTKNPSVEFTAEEETLLAIYKERRQQYVDDVIRRAIFVEDNFGNHVCVCISDRYNSQIGENVLDRYAVDYVAILDIDRGKASLRSLNYPVKEIAEAFGGGGHKLAAGFEMSGNELIHRFIRKPKRIAVPRGN